VAGDVKGLHEEHEEVQKDAKEMRVEGGSAVRERERHRDRLFEKQLQATSLKLQANR
jgi:hypothetical protein